MADHKRHNQIITCQIIKCQATIYQENSSRGEHTLLKHFNTLVDKPEQILMTNLRRFLLQT